jgi:hypothetical protein
MLKQDSVFARFLYGFSSARRMIFLSSVSAQAAIWEDVGVN